MRYFQNSVSESKLKADECPLFLLLENIKFVKCIVLRDMV